MRYYVTVLDQTFADVAAALPSREHDATERLHDYQEFSSPFCAINDFHGIWARDLNDAAFLRGRLADATGSRAVAILAAEV